MLQDTASLKNEQVVVLRYLLQDAPFAFMRNHAITFRKMVCLRDAVGFDDWLASSESSVAQLRTFALGLRRDYANQSGA